MEQGKTHLDDLFAAARNDAASGSELSEPEIVRLLEHSDSLQSGSLTTNKGIWIMTSILTTGAAALIAASALIGSSDAPNTTGRIESPASASIVTSPRTSLLSTPIVPQAVAVKDSGALSGGIDPTNMLSVFAPKEIAAVKPIEITPDELSKFGVEEKEGTGLSFFIKEGAGRSAEYMNIVIPEKGWGIVMKDDQATPPPSFFEPVVVTDARGNKRLTVFSDDSTS